jgi:tungsten cofactor oxidoreducase radical SAM maturase
LTDGAFRFPEGYIQSRRLGEGIECWLDHRDGAILLLPRVPDLRRLYIEPTTLCNLHCRTCVRNVWEDSPAHMEMDLYHQIVDQIGAMPELQRVVFSGFGEPLAHPHIIDMIRVVRDRGLAVTVGSNGLLLDRAMARALVELGVDRLVVSLDGVRPETYEGVRGAALSRVLDNIRGLNEVKDALDALSPALGLEFVALQSNIAELPHLTGLAMRLGAARVLVSNVLAYTDAMRDEILYGYEPRAPFDAGGWPIRAGPWVMFGTLELPRMHWGAERRCRFVHDRATVIGWDGSVVPCYALAHSYRYLAIDGRRKLVERYVLGSVAEQSLLEIWTSEEYCRFRNQVSAFYFPSCPDCDLRETCDLRERNQGCWGWNPSCADCLWAQEIVRCP